MPDDTYEIPDIPQAEQDLLASTEERFYECGECAVKPGSPALCADCLERRSEHSQTGRTRRPIYRSLRNNEERGRYLRYLWRERDGLDDSNMLITEEDLDREFPDRRHERLPPFRWGSIATHTREERMRFASLPPGPRPRGADIPDGVAGSLSELLSLQREADHFERQIFQGLNVVPANVPPGRVYMMPDFSAEEIRIMAELERRGNPPPRPMLEPALMGGDPYQSVNNVANPEAEDATMTLDRVRDAIEELRSFGLVGVDPAVEGSDQTVVDFHEMTRHQLMTANFGLVYGRASTPIRNDWVGPEVGNELARVVATFIATEYDVEDIENLTIEIQGFPVYYVRELFGLLNMDPMGIGLQPIPDFERIAYHQQVVELAERIRPLRLPTAPGTSNSPSRFERELDVQEGVTRLPEAPPPRASRPLLPAKVSTYLSNVRNDRIRAAFEKLSGHPLDLTPPSRFEKLIWDDE